MTRASVVIPTYNKKERLELVLEGFKYQTEDTRNFEVLLVDDGSSDGTEEIAANNVYEFKLSYFRQKNMGRSCARNTGINHSKSELIVFCDDDVIPDRDFIRLHLKRHADGNPKAVHGRIYNLPYLKFFKNPQTGELAAGVDDENDRLEFIKRYLISMNDVKDMAKITEQKKLTYFEKTIYSAFVNNCGNMQWLGFTGGNASCPRRLLEKVGGFDENFGKKWGCEDLEIGYRLFLEGVGFEYSTDACCYHIAHARMTFRDELMESVKRFYNKHPFPQIRYLDKLILGEIRDINEYYRMMEDMQKNEGERGLGS